MSTASLSDLTSLGVLGAKQDAQYPHLDLTQVQPPSAAASVSSLNVVQGCTGKSRSIQPARVNAISRSAAKYQPSAILKAYASALKSHLSIQGDLSAADCAIFVASPLQRGVPIGVKEPFINQQTYEKTNCVQKNDSPIFRLGNGDFFEWLHE